MKRTSIKINAVLNTIQTLMSMLFPLITFPYASRVLSVESIGKYNFSNSIISYFALLAGLGILHSLPIFYWLLLYFFSIYYIHIGN